MLACFPSLARTPPRSPAIGVMISCQCSPRSVVRRRVPPAPAIQQIFFAGAEPLISVAAIAATCGFHVLPPSLECAMAPCSPNRQILFPFWAVMPDGSSPRMDITFRDIAGKSASFFLGADVTSTVSAVTAAAASVTVTCCAADGGGAGGGGGAGAGNGGSGGRSSCGAAGLSLKRLTLFCITFILQRTRSA